MGSEILNLSIFEKRFRSLFKEAPFSAALLSGDDFVIDMANEVTLDLWGKDSSIIGMPLLKAMPEMKDQHVFKLLQHVYHSGETFEGKEQTAYLPAGNTIKKVYVNFTYKPLRDDEGKITGVLAVGYDVSDQVIARQKIEESDARMRLIIDSVGMGTFERNYITGQTTTSSRFDSIFGFTSPVSHEAYVSRIHPDDLAIRNIAQQKAVQTGKLSYESRLLLPDQSIRWVRINGVINFDENRNPERLLGTALDITEEKLALLKLQESEQRFRTLITETPEVGAGLYLGREFRIQYVNEVMLKFWGKDHSIIGKTFIEALPVLQGQPFLQQLDNVYTTGVAFTGREVKAYLEIDGIIRPYYFNYTYKALRDHLGEIYAIHHMAVDVTEQVENKLTLIESEEAVKRLFAQTPVGIAVFKGNDLVVEMVNETMLIYWGRNREEVINRPVWEVLPEVAQQGIDKISQQVFETGISYESPETPVNVLRNGTTETIVVHFGFQPQRNSQGEIIGLLAIANDVTDLVNARKKVEKNELKLYDLANSMPQVVWIAEEDGSVTYYNDRVTEFSDVKYEAGMWKWEGFVHPADITLTAKTWNQAVTNLTPYETEHRIKMKDGSYRWHLSRAYPFKREGGIKWYGTATDVHDQKLLEMNLENIVNERTMELQRSNEDLQQFAHVASHDLKEPVRKIKLFSLKLQEEFKHVLNDRGTGFIDKIIRATDRIYTMIEGVLDYSSVTTESIAFENIDLNQIIKSIETDFEVLINEKKAIITYGKLPTFKGISPLIYQLFYNLINNSLKFSKSDVPAVIHIQCDPVNIAGKMYYKIGLSDNGIGFDEAYAEQIFQTFFRLNSKDKYEGTGLGLALCKKIVERHGGMISAQGEKDKGAEFTILFPQ
ncbi:PAS domain-containing protein [Chryseolinea sp. H1M3-3]|uniref:PAS domain-containing protein n=1 Tax=Chryseolinea sp. H1M3-3 TaxID=3034144 RepID=UPI0023EC4905|nr:PAS domain-containing protein [Chryseolinea sp. H1M3-3]